MNQIKLFSIIFFILIIFLCFDFLVAQTDSLNQIWAEFSEDETDIIELIEELSKNPVNINSHDRNEILRIPLITESQADSILFYRKTRGNFRNKRQIRPILGPEIYDLVKEFIAIRKIQRYNGQFIHKSYYSFDPPPEIESGYYKGNEFYDLNKVYYNFSNNIKAGLVTHKDPGEENYLDFYSGYLTAQYQKVQVILGRYNFQFGEGLTYSNGFGQQKSSMVSLPFRSLRYGGFSSLSSSEGTGFFGLCTNFRSGPVFFSTFYSNLFRDAQMTRDYTTVTGLDSDGYHRTDAELYKKHQVHEMIYGAALNYNILKSLKIGAAISRLSYSPGLNFTPEIVGQNEIRRQFYKFHGTNLRQYSVYSNVNLDPIHISTELASSDKGGPGFIQSVFYDQKEFNWGIKYWYLSRSFQSPFGRIFDNAASFPQGEQGYYFSFAFRPLDKLFVRAFKIYKKDLWRTYFNTMPLGKDEILLELESAFQNVGLIARLRIKDREELPEQNYLPDATRFNSRQYITRLQLDYKPEKSIRLRTRWEYTKLSQQKEQGTLIFEDLKYAVTKILSLSSRIIAYRTKSYNSRLYEYESDIPGSFANYAVYGEGYLWYLLIKWSVTNRFSVYLKYRYNVQRNKNLLQERILDPQNELDRTLRFQLKILL